MERAAFVLNIFNKTSPKTGKRILDLIYKYVYRENYGVSGFHSDRLWTYFIEASTFCDKKHLGHVPFLLFLRFPSFFSFGFTFFSSPDSPSLTVSLCLSSLCLYLGFFDSSSSSSSSSSESDSELASFLFPPVRDKSQYNMHTGNFFLI